MVTIDLKLNISAELLEQLQHEATSRNLPLDTVVSEALSDYFEEPTEEEILTSIRLSVEAALAGDVRPIDEVLQELREEFDFNADEG